MRRFFPAWLLLLPLLASGCVTHKLWSESTLDEWNEPAGNPNLRLFQDVRQDDFLVVYDEYSDRHLTTRSRAYFLRPNLSLLAQHRCPDFVSTNSIHGLKPIQIFLLRPPNSPSPPYAVTTGNPGEFTVTSAGHESGPYALPLYNDGVGRWERIAWTPLTVTADLTIVGGVLVIICWGALAQTDASISVH